MLIILTYDMFFQLTDKFLQNQDLVVVMVELEGIEALDPLLGFKKVDSLTKQAGEIMTSCIKGNDFIGQISRYHYAIIFTKKPSIELGLAAAKEIHMLLSGSFIVDENKLFISPKMGISFAQKQSCSANELLRQAYAALNYGKLNKNPIQVFSESHLPSILPEHNLMADLDEAIKNNELYLVLQPIIDVETNKIKDTEALLRWHHPEQGMMQTDTLIKLIEQSELIHKLTYWVISAALSQCAEYRKQGSDAGIHINLSSLNLQEPDLPNIIEGSLKHWGIPANKLTLELTESAIMADEEVAKQQLFALKSIGAKLSLDQFGTGYSSIERLVALPFDEVKVDLQFIKHISQNISARRAVDSIINMAHQLKLTVVSGSVENAETLIVLKELGCDYAQGYHIGKPAPLKQLLKSLTK